MTIALNGLATLHNIKKKHRNIRLCGDCSRLNTVPKQYRELMSRINDFNFILIGKNIFNHIDIIDHLILIQ